MRLKTHHLAVSLMIGAIVLSSLAWLGLPSTAVASCPTGASVNIGQPASGGATLAGQQILIAHTTTSASTGASAMTFVVTSPTYMVLGQGVIEDPYTWKLNWDSRSIPNGTYQMIAIARYGTDTNLDCASASVAFNVNNAPTQTPKLTAAIIPNGWQGLPGQSVNFNVNGVYQDQFGRQSPLPAETQIHWGASGGTLSTTVNTPSTIYKAGNTAGSFIVNVTVGYAGLSAKASAAIKIGSSSGSGSTTTTLEPAPETTDDDSQDDTEVKLTTEDVTRLSTMPTIFRPATTDVTNSKPVVAVKTLGCLEKRLGNARFQEISSGKTVPTDAERRQGARCFSGSDRIPSLLAPVTPSKVDELKSEDSIVKLDGYKNQVVTNSKGEKVTAIVINGTGAANSSIFLYIFSDPMVLRAETDKDGKWSYVLENPLDPGDHEIYAVAEKDAGNFVRTPAVPIAIAAAGSGADGSLVIERELQPAQIGFIAAAVVMMIAAIFLLLRLRRHRHLVAPGTDGHAASAAPAVIQPTGLNPATPTPPEPPANETKT